MKDNASPYSARLAIAHVAKNISSISNGPSYLLSPDINTREHLSSIVKRHVYENRKQYTMKEYPRKTIKSNASKHQKEHNGRLNKINEWWSRSPYSNVNESNIYSFTVEILCKC